ncbi:hypothetical protein [Roseateles toxinivorans]|uniref:hypothetical protein n=1 Tax=Roseateles toxinivorans TaxID=270368 RepID=UPI0010611F57|nr:hypothetical protein [Roseateles toxinivorans]
MTAATELTSREAAARPGCSAASRAAKAPISHALCPAVDAWVASLRSPEVSHMMASAPERLLLLGLIVDQPVDAVITITPDQRIAVANSATSRLFG